LFPALPLLAAALLLALLLAVPLSGAPSAWAQGTGTYFGPRPEVKAAPAPAPGESPAGGSYFGSQAAAPAPSGWHLPRWARVAVTRVAEVQRRLNAALSDEVLRLHTSQFWAAAGTLFLLSFLYGVFHAVGPGHGKVITTAYLATRNARFQHALLMCAANALAQSLTAILLVSAFAAVVDLGSEWILGKSIWLEHLSYALIATVGGVMLYGAATGRQHRHGHGGARGRGAAQAHGPPALRELLSMAIAVGIRPCTGAILVLLFTLANHVFWVGVLATLLMGVGVALTLSLMGAATVGARMAITQWVAEESRLSRVGARVMTFGAGLLLLLGGLLLLYASWVGGSLGG
jgi:ABC-type nickel/cobalt efflux system permease component RcnA